MDYIDKYEGRDTYGSLAASIILQAIKDYERGLKCKKVNSDYYARRGKIVSFVPKDMRDVEEFFNSQWFVALSGNMDGKSLKRRLDKNFDTYGKCILNASELKRDICGTN